MSVYITIEDGDLVNLRKNKLAIRISSFNKTVLKTHSVEPTRKPIWKSALVGSIKQNQLTFETVEEVKNDVKVNGIGQLYFSSFRFTPQKQLPFILTLSNGDKLHLSIFYTEKKNYVGSIEFYQESETMIPSSLLPSPNKGKFTQMQPQKFHELKTSKSPQPVQFYNGPCKTFNFFSCCDQGVDDQQYTVVEEFYRDK